MKISCKARDSKCHQFKVAERARGENLHAMQNCVTVEGNLRIPETQKKFSNYSVSKHDSARKTRVDFKRNLNKEEVSRRSLFSRDILENLLSNLKYQDIK